MVIIVSAGLGKSQGQGLHPGLPQGYRDTVTWTTPWCFHRPLVESWVRNWITGTHTGAHLGDQASGGSLMYCSLALGPRLHSWGIQRIVCVCMWPLSPRSGPWTEFFQEHGNYKEKSWNPKFLCCGDSPPSQSQYKCHSTHDWAPFDSGKANEAQSWFLPLGDKSCGGRAGTYNAGTHNKKRASLGKLPWPSSLLLRFSCIHGTFV